MTHPEPAAQPDPEQAPSAVRVPGAPIGAARVDRIVEDLLLTDAVTAHREPSDGLYVVHEDDLPYLVATVLSLHHDLATADG